jgi:hypothetical protein
MNTDRNPYAPPSADVVLNQTNSTTQKKSLLPMWLAALYCIVIGTGHLVMLVQITYRTWDMDDWLPGWAHAVAFMQPVARLAAGISLIRRFRVSPAIFGGLSAFTAIFPLVWQRYWTYMTGRSLFTWPLSLLYLADLMVLVLITRYVFALRSRGLLR